MKIALVVPGGVDRSGSERVIPCLLWLIERLAARDEVHVFAISQEPRPGGWPLLGATVHNAGAWPKRPRALGQMLREHGRGRFDAVHAWWAAGPGAIAAVFGRLTGTPMALTLPGGDLSAIREIGYGALLSPTGRMWTRFAIANAGAVTVPSAWMQAQARTLGIETIRMPLGVALDRWPAAAPRRREASVPLRLLHVASLNAVKDQETLLVAMRALRDRGMDFQLDVVGLDTLGGAVQRRCSELGLENAVRFHGFVTHAEERAFFDGADVLVMSSLHEGAPIVLAEAAVAGIPTVGTEVGQIADWAPEAAIAVPVRDSGALADAIAALDRDEDRRLALAGEAQRRALHEDAGFTADQVRMLYGKLATGR